MKQHVIELQLQLFLNLLPQFIFKHVFSHWPIGHKSYALKQKKKRHSHKNIREIIKINNNIRNKILKCQNVKTKAKVQFLSSRKIEIKNIFFKKNIKIETKIQSSFSSQKKKWKSNLFFPCFFYFLFSFIFSFLCSFYGFLFFPPSSPISFSFSWTQENLLLFSPSLKKSQKTFLLFPPSSKKKKINLGRFNTYVLQVMTMMMTLPLNIYMFYRILYVY